MKRKTTSIILSVCGAALLTFGVWSCKKDHNSGNSVTLSEGTAAQVTIDAVSPATGGLVSQISSSSSLSTGVAVNGLRKVVTDALPCGTVKDTTITYSNGTTLPTFNYKLAWETTASCSVPVSVAVNFGGSGTYSGLVLGSQFNSSGVFTITGFGDADYTYNSVFTRSGTVFEKSGNQSSFNHSLTITSTDIKYDPITQQIVSGTAAVSIKLTNSAGTSFSYAGTITFEGGKTAKLKLNSGTVYDIAWS